MFFQTAPAETTGYMIFGYVVIFGTLIIYLVSLFTRWRNLRKEMEILEELDENG